MNKEIKFLVVDDFSTMRKLLKKSLMELGHNCIDEAENGESAWQLIEQAKKENRPYEFIISDWNMPQMSGIELLKKFRADASNAKIPFVMVTAESEQKQILEAIKNGCNDYIVKPFSPLTIKEKILRVFNKFINVSGQVGKAS